MSETYNAQLAKERHEQVLARLDSIVAEARAANGRTRTLETKVAVLEASIPEDLGDRLTRVEERSPSKAGGGWGAVTGAIGGFVAGLLK